VKGDDGFRSKFPPFSQAEMRFSEADINGHKIVDVESLMLRLAGDQDSEILTANDPFRP